MAVLEDLLKQQQQQEQNFAVFNILDGFGRRGGDDDNKNDNKNDNENKNENDNKNENSNENKNEVKNELDNKLDNSVDNKVENKLDNKVDNTVDNKIENHVEVKVDVDLGLDLDLSDLRPDNDVIDIEEIKDIYGSVVMPDAVTQTLNGGGNQFNIDQVNNLVDNDKLYHPTVSFWGDGELKWENKAEGGEAKVESATANMTGDGSIAGVGSATADAIASQEAFTQNIVMGANIQFNQIEMSVAGHGLTSDDTL